MKFQFHPKLLDTLPGYGKAQFTHDVSAGLTVGVLALPLAMAFAIASGMSPTAGIWTSIVAGLLISLLGGSRVQIGGPTGAFIPIIYAIVMDYGVQNLLIASMLAGVILFAMGAFKLGNMIRFIPLSVVIGFTNGIAVVIFIAQIKDFLGLAIEDLPGEFFGKMAALASHLHTIHLPTVGLAVASLVILLGWNRLATRFPALKRAPGPLAVLVIGTAANALLNLPVETIGSRFGGIPQEIPPFSFPALDPTTLGKLMAPALTIALLGAIESLLSARVADSQIEDRHNPNQELLAQGLANFVAPLFGGFAATGAIARTATNIRAGGRTPVAGIVHALVLLAVVLVLAPLAKDIPLATLSAIVVVVSINMGEWHAFSPKELARYSNQYRTILLGTFFVTVLFDLTLAVELGMVLASLFFIYRMSDLTRMERIPLEDHYGVEALSRADGTPRIVAYRMFGSLFFGAANKLESMLQKLEGNPETLILDMDKVINMDTTGLDILQTLHRDLKKTGTRLILCDLNSQPGSLIFRSGFLDRLGEDNVAGNITEALMRAQHRAPQQGGAGS
ncbi:MAG: sulfate permease [Rhodocyclaceae bacterium]|nr:sulfate permease [Rhodocyclaceae bacterium]MCP5232941.1 sulfate permease [Zoogloeaceae bacterium]MCB1912324.1 sulfate permease [Rhodocyclaceae bacterium]MCP5241197.1 sulfate permease [Zoogloeaceae bacterium]MCP5255001.1 sulfate permease [Zoogloeaceae bacterium]